MKHKLFITKTKNKEALKKDKKGANAYSHHFGRLKSEDINETNVL